MAFLSGCTSSKDVDYDRSYLDDPHASHEQVQAALYDYVGAVYGEKDKVRFDNHLSAEERVYVEDMYGKFDPTTSADTYLKQVKLKKLAEYREPQHCQRKDIRADISTYQDSTLRNGYSLSVSHDCLRVIADQYSKIELNIAAHPQNYVFFLEGDSLEKQASKEHAYFKEIAKVLGIQTYDATVRIDDPEFLAEAEKQGFTKAEFAFMHLLHNYDINRMYFNTEGMQYIDIPGIARKFNITEKELSDLIKLHLTISSDPPHNILLLRKETLILLPKLFEAYHNIGNKIAAKRAQEIIGNTFGFKQSLFVYGHKHADIAQIVFGN